MAIHITRVYTRGGDKGETSIVGGLRIKKSAQKLETYGTVDELITALGMARSVLETGHSRLPDDARSQMEPLLRRLQDELFDVGSILATPAKTPYPKMPEISGEHIKALEEQMDKLQEELPHLKSFVLPGGTLLNGWLHQCRVIARRAERETARLAEEEALYPNVLEYLNRVSDLFFVMARYVAKEEGATEYLWSTGLRNEAAPRR